MKAVLDENVPRKLIPDLRKFGCEVERFPNDWKGLRNGGLLDRLEELGFDCLITCDKNIEWQQPLLKRRVAVVVLPLQDLAALRSIADEIATAITSTEPGKVRNLLLDRRSDPD